MATVDHGPAPAAPRGPSCVSTVVCALALWCQLSPVAVAQTRSGGEAGEPIEVTADEAVEVGDGGNTVRARGNVEVRRGGTVFGADSVALDRAAGKLQARGSVFVRAPRYRLQASELELEVEDETGTALDPEVFLEDRNLSVRGSRLEKFAGQTWEVEDGSFTTCLCERGPPPWRIGARKVRLRENREAVGDDVTFYVYDVPVLYLPYAYFPHRTERATGLLFPSLGWSDRDGLLYRQPFFWAPDESNDATVEFAVESRTRVGVTGQYRTVLDRSTDGAVEVSYFDERRRGPRSAEDGNVADPAVPADRWRVSLTHRSGAAWATYSDVALYSDSLAARELTDSSGVGAAGTGPVRASRYSASRLGFYRSGSGMTLEGELEYQQDLVQPQKHALHRVPRLSFHGVRALGERLDLGWDVDLTHYVREQGADGMRLDLRPEITWPVAVGRHFRLLAGVALRETLYRLDSVEGKYDASRNDYTGRFARASSRELVEVRGRLSTSLSRAYGGSRGIRHVVEPAVGYLFVPSTDQSGIPVWDPVDRIQRRNLLTFSLRNRFWARGRGGGLQGPRGDAAGRGTGGGAPGPFARASVGVSFDLDRGGRDALSDVDVALGFDPADRLDLTAGLGVDPGTGDLRQASVGFSLHGSTPPEAKAADADFRRPDGVSLAYRYVQANPLSPLGEHANLDLLADCPGDPRCVGRDSVNGVRVSALWRMTDHVVLRYDGAYDGAASRFTSNRGGVKYLSRCECWTLALFVDRQSNPDRTVVSFKFNLLGLGS